MGDITNLVYLLIYVLVICLFIWLAFWALTRTNMQEPFRTIVMVLVVIVALIFVLRLLGML